MSPSYEPFETRRGSVKGFQTNYTSYCGGQWDNAGVHMTPDLWCGDNAEGNPPLTTCEHYLDTDKLEEAARLLMHELNHAVMGFKDEYNDACTGSGSYCDDGICKAIPFAIPSGEICGACGHSLLNSNQWYRLATGYCSYKNGGLDFDPSYVGHRQVHNNWACLSGTGGPLISPTPFPWNGRTQDAFNPNTWSICEYPYYEQPFGPHVQIVEHD
ncbi:MAG: hypothetical protein JRH20_21840 [Deltaproteobacteria bacterium]|nr:hypothetical protein [Deltaproteobacteria bacterium]